MSEPDLESLLGRRITGAIVKERRQSDSQPSAQLFLILDDGTYAEVYAPVGGLCFSMPWEGTAARARAYMDATMKTVREAYLPSI
jgi:hypothetical protein